MVLLILYFGRFLPKDFAKLGRILNCMGIWLKLLPKFIILLHYVIFILILVVIGQVANGSCAKSQIIDSDTNLPEDTNMQKDATILAGIISGMWVLMHFGGYVIRSLLYVDPFLLDPYDPKANRVWRILC